MFQSPFLRPGFIDSAHYIVDGHYPRAMT